MNPIQKTKVRKIMTTVEEMIEDANAKMRNWGDDLIHQLLSVLKECAIPAPQKPGTVDFVTYAAGTLGVPMWEIERDLKAGCMDKEVLGIIHARFPEVENHIDALYFLASRPIEEQKEFLKLEDPLNLKEVKARMAKGGGTKSENAMTDVESQDHTFDYDGKENGDDDEQDWDDDEQDWDDDEQDDDYYKFLTLKEFQYTFLKPKRGRCWCIEVDGARRKRSRSFRSKKLGIAHAIEKYIAKDIQAARNELLSKLEEYMEDSGSIIVNISYESIDAEEEYEDEELGE